MKKIGSIYCLQTLFEMISDEVSKYAMPKIMIFFVVLQLFFTKFNKKTVFNDMHNKVFFFFIMRYVVDYEVFLRYATICINISTNCRVM